MSLPIRKATDVIFHEGLVDYFRQLIAESPNGEWLEMILGEYPYYRITPKTPAAAQLGRLCTSATEWMGVYSMSQWLATGMHVAVPTQEQAESFANIAIELEVPDFSSPFKAVAVEIPHNPIFESVIVYCHNPHTMILSLVSKQNVNDVVTTITHHGKLAIERSLETLGDESLAHCLQQSISAQRIALNMCLCLSNWGCNTGPRYPKDHAVDQMYAKESSERGERARKRLREAVTLARFPHEVIIRRTPERKDEYNKTDRTMSPHWVRGHWKTQPHGPRNSLRKRILVAPYLVHPEMKENIPQKPVIYKDYRQ